MKKLYLLLIFLSFIQCASKKNVSESKNSNLKSIIENEKLNIIYRGIRNPLTIYFPNADSIQVNGLGVQKTDENKYYIAPGSGTKVEITVIGFINGEELMDKREFRILDIQKPYASIHNSYGKITLSKDKLANATIKVHVPQFVLELPEIESFQYQINKEQSSINSGNNFSELVKKKIQNLKKGDSLLIDNIKLITDKSNIDRAKISELKIYIE